MPFQMMTGLHAETSMLVVAGGRSVDYGGARRVLRADWVFEQEEAWRVRAHL